MAVTKKPGSAKGPARKNGGSPEKNGGNPEKNGGSPGKNGGKAEKNEGTARPAAGGGAPVEARPATNGEGPEENVDARGIDAPDLPEVALVAPKRTGRVVDDQGEVLTEAEVRLKLAWRHRDALDPALPAKPPFHALAWTALRTLQAPRAAAGGEGDDVGPADAALEALVEELSVLRNVVEYTTRPGDLAREALKFGVALKPTRALVELAPEVIAGARKWQPDFPALTDGALARAEAALARAAVAVKRDRAGEVSARVARASTADDRQLALDVLLDCLDHLRAAARVNLSPTRPKLAAVLTAPIEKPARAKPPEREPAPAPPPPDRDPPR